MKTPSKNKKEDYMLDTVALRLTYPDFKVTYPNLFDPPFVIQVQESRMNNNFQYGRHRFMKYQQNRTQQDKQADIYMPRLTAYQRYDEDKPTYDLHIEFSIPKMIFGNSLQELVNDKFGTVIYALKLRLQRMGVEATETALRNAVVVKAHFGKNIPLPHPVTAQDAISTLYKADVGKRKQVNIRHYGNDGQALYFYASSANIIFYDKVKEIEGSKVGALDKDKLKHEKQLFKQMKNENKPEILRFEVRFTKQQSLGTFLSRALKEKIKSMSFERIFNKELCQKVLLTSWEDIVATPASQLALKMERPLEEVFDALIKDISPTKKKQAHSLNKSLASFGLYMLINNYGVRKTRNKIEKNWTDKSWKRLSEKIKSSATTLKELPTIHAVSDIQSALERFERYDWRPE